ncbi:nucleotide exchange factor GrpE [Candidatus Cerribacteria bacterium 'Amazon FNV 2010 28 9']|uniref:Protein GrpE n=1 Tax=Candidatus Cerribacteria bacterium 'Amazon FNV 2010 28 9' TaxID=2081795 RepID=A0A317JQ59_9BACT|nr:MAG: nucleotide exchange factor GrpE [Candidatus Cerribacteria bacterium 'Amazon FNV 2010 28 9']
MSDDKKQAKREEERKRGREDHSTDVKQAKVEQTDHSTCEQQIAQLQSQLDQANEKYRRSLADFQNLERQTMEAQTRYVKLATEGFVQELLQPFSHLKLAAAHLKDKGLDMVIAQFVHVFESQGLTEIDVMGKPFDPVKMEAIDTAEGDPDVVVAVHEAGYELNGIVVKPAKVVVGKTK